MRDMSIYEMIVQKEMVMEDFDELTNEYAELLKMAVEDIKIAANAEYMCDVCTHFVECETCKYHNTMCDVSEYKFGKCPGLVMTPCNGCDYDKGTNFLWRGYLNRTKDNTK